MTNLGIIANHIEQLLREQCRSVAWLSEVTGIADKTLRRRLRAPGRFTLAELNAIARALGVKLEDLFAAANETKVAA